MSSIASLLPTAVVEAGAGGAVGFAVGYALKKVLKLLLVAAGLLATIIGCVVLWLQDQGIITITVDYAKLNTLMISSVTWAMAQTSNLVTLTAQTLAVGGGATAGFLLGLKKG